LILAGAERAGAARGAAATNMAAARKKARQVIFPYFGAPGTPSNRLLRS